MRSRVPPLALTFAATLAVAFAACTAGATPTPTPTPTPTLAPPAEGTLRVAVTGAALHQDLHREVSEWATLFGSGNGYNRLFRFVGGPEVELPSLRIECDLCATYEFVDDTTFEITMDPDARWQGAGDFPSRPVAASDVVWSLERMREPGSPHEHLLDSVDTIAETSGGTVRFKLHYRDADLPLKLASPYAVIMAPDSVEGVDIETGRVLGSGPWRYERGSTGQVTLTAWEDYWRDGEPAANTIQFLPVADFQTGTVLLGNDRMDMAQVSLDQWATLEGRYESVVIDRQGRGVLFGANAKREPFTDVAARRAIFAALDPWRAIEDSLGIGWVGTGVPLAGPSWSVGDNALRTTFHSEASDGGGASFTLTVGNFGEAYVAHGEALAGQLRAAGFDVETEVLTRGAYLRRVWEDRDYDVFVGPMPPTDTPSAFLSAMVHTEGAANVTGAGSGELDAIIDAQAVELDPERRAGLVREAQGMMLDGAWFFMAAGLSERWAYNERVVDPPRAFPQGSGDWWRHVSVREGE